ncbi:MAG TPA: peptide ABC transporter substrate-binding protein [Methylomirabilota bacterium]|nr:peptide ABC transporter substrate-binding protein [Methylomirabilota bacterium]
MTRTDTFVVGTLVLLLALVAGLIGVPALRLSSSSSSPSPTTPGASTAPAVDRPYVEGALGLPVSVTPLTARTQVDRDLVALVFSGLMRNGPGGTIVPDLAERWSVDASGKTWTVDIREDARWQDGEPVTSDDVIFTIETMQDPAYTGPGSTSWSEVTVTASGPRRVIFTLQTPLGGFLQALTQPLAPAHLLADIPIEALGDDPFGRQPLGSGPFALVELTDTSASLVAAADLSAAEGEASVEPSASATADSLSSAAPTKRPSRPQPYLTAMEFRFYTDADTLASDFRAGALDAVSGISRQLAAELGTDPGARLLRYPGATLTAVLLNLRPGHPEFASPAVRTALLKGINRARLIDEAYAMSAASATGPIPPSSPMFDPAADPLVTYDRKAASKALTDAGWTHKKDGWYLPKAKTPLSIEVVSPTQDTNPGLFAATAAVVRDWTALGLTVTHVALPPGQFVTDRLATGTFQAAVVDVTVGLDPDLYPLMASSQTLTGGSNVMGLQDPTLDTLLAKARAPGTDAARKAAYADLQKQLATGRYLLPLAFADEVVVAHDTLEGPLLRQASDLSDRFWDVLTWRLAVDR